MYGSLLSTGGPNSLRPSESVLRPPRITVPPSGMLTVVWIWTIETAGCWTNWVNGIGWPWAPPSNTGVMKDVTGNRAVTDDAALVMLGTMLRRTKRRSAVTTAWMVSDTTELSGKFKGLNTSWPPDWKICTSMTKNCVSLMSRLDVWPLNSVSLGACMTLVRRSAWAASMNRNTWMSLGD